MKDNFIKIEDKKFKVDPNNEGEALKDEQGNPIPFTDEDNDSVKEGVKDENKVNEGKVDPSDLTLQDLAKSNPEVAKLLKEHKDVKSKIEEIEKEKEEAKKKQLEKEGKFQELAKQAEQEKEEMHGKMVKAEKLYKEYKGTVKSLLEAYEPQVAEDKKGLIPEELTPRKRLEYIIRNAKNLGVSIMVNQGNQLPSNDSTPPTDKEGEMQAELDDLIKKGKDRTYVENQKMIELAKKIKEIRNNKEKSQN